MNDEDNCSFDEEEVNNLGSKHTLEKLNTFKNLNSFGDDEDDANKNKILNFDLNMDNLYRIMESQTSKKLKYFESTP